VLALDTALTKLEALDARKARVVELRFFAGFEVEEIAQLLDVSLATVHRDWRFARAWLFDELRKA
jgi:RNA polymerase sigma factor (sigma-70 family)